MESPKFTYHSGDGTFVLNGSSVNAPFRLYHNPHCMGLIAEGESLWKVANESFNTDSLCYVSGMLSDGRQVKAKSLLIVKISPITSSPVVEFSIFDGVFIGKDREMSPNESKYPLTNYFDGEFSFFYEGWGINTIPCKDAHAANTLAKNWKIPVEGMILQIKNDRATKDQHQEFVRIIMCLLSLATGTGVSSYRHYFVWDNEEIEIWKKMTGDEIGPGPIVPEHELAKFLLQALSAWEKLSHKQKNAIRLARHHINLSAIGYLDTRLFHIVQPWEFLAEAWDMQGELSKEVICLRTQLKRTIKQWNKDHNNYDPNGFWGSRISSIFNWPRLRDAIEKLSANFGLDLVNVGLDLNLLKSARDSVAHSGEIGESLAETQKEAINILITGQYCLQLLLLRILKYQGQVYHYSKGWRRMVNIDQALTTKMT